MKDIGYIRVSTVDQNTERQLDGLKLDKTFTDKCSGKDTHRPKLEELLEFVREGDTIHVHDISRMARNVADLLELIKTINGKGCSIRFHKEGLLFTGEQNAMQDLMLSVLGAVYQFEREMLLERQREGIAKAKSAGKYNGRPKSVDEAEIRSMLAQGVSIRKTAAELGVSVSSVQRAKKSTAIIL